MDNRCWIKRKPWLLCFFPKDTVAVCGVVLRGLSRSSGDKVSLHSVFPLNSNQPGLRNGFSSQKRSLSARLKQSLHLYWSSFTPRKARPGGSSQDLITTELPCRRCRLQLDVGQYSLQCRYSIAILSALQTDRKANQLVYKPSGRLANAPVLFRCCNRKIARGSPSNDWRALTLRLARKLANSERERASMLLKCYTKIGVDKNVGAPSPGRFEKINIYKYVYTMRLPEYFVHGNDVIK